jgi:c(7)-type cytochrome triheme protein
MTLLVSIALFVVMLLARGAFLLLVACAFAGAVWCALRLAQGTAGAGRWAVQWVRAGGGRGLALLVLCFGALALAGGKLQLPEDAPLPQGKGSPGTVVFQHRPHVKAANPDCTQCHPRSWKITEAAATADGQPVTHARMEKGELCGACHDGKYVFAMDDCEMCHASAEE